MFRFCVVFLAFAFAASSASRSNLLLSYLLRDYESAVYPRLPTSTLMVAPGVDEEILKPYYCYLAPETGSCKADIPSYYYDAEQGGCLLFTYGGCEGNYNRFRTRKDCMHDCGDDNVAPTIPPTTAPDEAEDEDFPPPKPDLCYLPAEKGTCGGYFKMFFYNSQTDKCETFAYSGCGGNDNRFQKWDQCNHICGNGTVVIPPTTTEVPPLPGKTCSNNGMPPGMCQYYYQPQCRRCPSYPSARCVIDDCCKITYYVGSKRVYC